MEAAARLAGEWSYDEAGTAQAADLPGTSPEAHLSQRASDLAMAMMREQSSNSSGVTGTPAGLRQTMLMVGITPRTLTIGLAGNTVTVSYDGERPLELPAGGGWVDATTPQGAVEARIRWTGSHVAVERRIPGGGTIRDNLSILESGHLLASREVVWGRDARPVGLMVFAAN